MLSLDLGVLFTALAPSGSASVSTSASLGTVLASPRHLGVLLASVSQRSQGVVEGIELPGVLEISDLAQRQVP